MSCSSPWSVGPSSPSSHHLSPDWKPTESPGDAVRVFPVQSLSKIPDKAVFVAKPSALHGKWFHGEITQTDKSHGFAELLLSGLLLAEAITTQICCYTPTLLKITFIQIKWSLMILLSPAAEQKQSRYSYGSSLVFLRERELFCEFSHT